MPAGQRKHLRDGGDSGAGKGGVEPATAVELLELGQRHVAGPPGAVGGAVDGSVVHADEDAVARAVHIELHAELQGEAGVKGGQRVLCGASGEEGQGVRVHETA